MRSQRIFFKDREVLDYEKKRYRGFDQKIVDWREKRIAGRMLKQDKGSAKRILDIPCGYGRFSEFLAKNSVYLISADLSFSMVKRAMENRFSSGIDKGSGTACDAVEGLPFKAEIFDGIFSLRFFHHLHEREQRIHVLKEFFRVSSSWVIISFYSLNSLHKAQRRIRKMAGKSRAHINMMSKKDFIGEAREAGFYVEKICPLIKGLHSQHMVLLKKAESYSQSSLKRKS